MGTAHVLDQVGSSDPDLHAVSQLTAMGALADEVVGDLIRVRAGLIRGSDSNALKRAAALFGAAARSQAGSGNLWAASRIPDALRLIADSTSRSSGLPSDDARAWVADVASQLDSTTADSADVEVVAKLETQFRSIAVATLGASSDALRQRGYASSWLTA